MYIYINHLLFINYFIIIILLKREREIMSNTKRIVVVERAISSLGKGFDLTSDFRLKYCKGKERLVVLNDADHEREITVPGFGSVNEVSIDIKCDKGDRTRYQSDILNFNQVPCTLITTITIIIT